MPRATPLDDADDLAWLESTHLRGIVLPAFDSAIIYGNEDSPDRIELYCARTRDDGEPVYSWSRTDLAGRCQALAESWLAGNRGEVQAAILAAVDETQPGHDTGMAVALALGTFAWFLARGRIIDGDAFAEGMLAHLGHAMPG